MKKFSNKVNILKYQKKIFCVFFFKIILYLIKNNKLKENQLKVCLCVIGKNENLYVKEFVEHYKKLGYNKIFIYDNNDINGERFEDIISNEIKIGFVSIINYRGLTNPVQGVSYEDCYKKNSLAYNWLSFFDFDEFLELKPHNIKIQKFLNNKRYKYCENIKINWIYYSNEKSLYYINKPLKKRFIPISVGNKLIKSTVRGNLSTNYWFKARNPHSGNQFNSCSSSGKMINSSSPFNNPPDIRYAYLNHYYFKSFEEFCYKIKKGRADYYKNDSIIKIKKFYQKNKYDINKLNIMNKVFNLTFKYY